MKNESLGVIMIMSLYGPAWLRVSYWLCILMASYKGFVSFIGFYPDDIMMSVVAPALILVFVMGILWYPFNFIWMLFWDMQEDASYMSRIIISLSVGLGVFFLGTFFEWQLWGFPENDAQLLMLYWWDSVCALCLLYGLYCVYALFTKDSSPCESSAGATLFSLACLLGAIVAFASGSIGFMFFSEDLVANKLYLFAFFVAIAFAYLALVLPYSLIRQSSAQWVYLKHQTPVGQRVNYIKKNFKGYMPVLSIVISWFVGMWLFGAGLMGDTGNSSSSIIVLVNGVATGGMSGAGGALTSVLSKLLLFFMAAVLYMSASNGIAQWVVPLKKQEITSNQDDDGTLSDRVFFITRAAALSNSNERKKRFKIVALCAYVSLIIVSMSSVGVNTLLAAIFMQLRGIFGG